MQNWLRRAALCFSAGSVGALAMMGVVWGGARFAATTTLAAHLARVHYAPGFYVRIVGGGAVALLFLLPLMRGRWFVRGLLWGVIVAVLQIVAVPLLSHGSVRLALLPLFSTLILGCIWGIATAGALRLFGE